MPFTIYHDIDDLQYCIRTTIYLSGGVDEDWEDLWRLFGGYFHVGFVRFAEVDYNTYIDRLEERGIVRYRGIAAL